MNYISNGMESGEVMSESMKMVKINTNISMPSALTIAASTPTQSMTLSLNDSSVNTNVNLVDLGKKLLDASRNGETEEVRTLMQSGAPFTTDWLGTSPLHFAAQFGHSDTAEVLLRAGISRDARTKVDRTPLHIAAQEGHLAIVSLLIMHGADVDARDMLKMSPLHWAVERGHIDVVDCLLNNGADINLQSKFEKTPIDIAYDNGRLEMVPTLQKYVGQTRLKPEPKPISAPAVKMRPTVLPNKSNRTPKSVKNYQNLNKPVLIPGNFANTWKKSINLENVRQILTGSGDISMNSEDISNSSNPILATLAALAGAGTSTCGTSVAEALQWLETHGVSMNNTSTDAALFQNALESGQTMSLTEAGKLALSWVKDQQTQVSTASTTANSSNKNSKVITIVADSAQLPQIINHTQATPIVLVSGSSLQDSAEAQSHNSSNAKLNRKNASLKLNAKTLTPTYSRVTNSSKSANIKHVLISTSNSNNDSVSTQLHEIEKENNKLQHELKIVKQENENYKTRLLEKDCELENYKTRLLEKEREIEEYKKQLEKCAINE